jgi:hypothetical protein
MPDEAGEILGNRIDRFVCRHLLGSTNLPF